MLQYVLYSLERLESFIDHKLNTMSQITISDVDIQCIIVAYVKLLQVDPEIITFLVQMGVIGEIIC